MKTLFSNPLAAIKIGAVTVFFAIFFGILLPQQVALSDQRAGLQLLNEKIEQGRGRLREAERLQPLLHQKQQELAQAEAELSAPDMYFHMLKRLKKLAGPSVDLVVDPSQTEESGGVYKTPYRTITFPVRGVGRYRDLGVFLSELENSCPYAKVQNLEIEPLVSDRNEEQEKLVFKFALLTLAQPAGPAPELLVSLKQN